MITNNTQEEDVAQNKHSYLDDLPFPNQDELLRTGVNEWSIENPVNEEFRPTQGFKE